MLNKRSDFGSILQKLSISGRLLAIMSEYQLPYGTTAEVAVYTEHAHHLAMMRKILLRMNSWKTISSRSLI
ncbi:hypothetical protein [Actinobacillus porcitonsillarum]|uniref:hypothetical protein n=1 Tax=Actinobacillus porcitonsillarum TaxID=189834 RepID=UPI000F62D846|nr:hypothetical protein [Actinobacillus porcitonsillarum]